MQYPFESTGKKTAVDQLRLDHNQYKGQLHYVAEFVPALALAGVKFESGLNELEQAAGDGGGSDAETVDDGSIKEDPMDGIPAGITSQMPLTEEDEVPEEAKKGHTAGAPSIDAAGTTEASHTRETTQVEDDKAGITMPKEELLKQRKFSGC